MKKLKYLLFSVFALGYCWFVQGHEKIPSYLQIKVNNGEAVVSFKYPLNKKGEATIFLSFPDDWKELSSYTSLVDNSEIKDMVFSFKEEKGFIKIRRTSSSDSSLIINIINDGKSSTTIVGPKEEIWEIDLGTETGVSVFKSFTFLGMEHILMGIDHLLFVLALLFLVSGKKLLMAVTAFTLAHSITLAISSLHIFSLPSTVVEALIAFSIVLMAVEVFRPQENSSARNYIVISFFFGLLHGFGFAGALAELGLPEGNLLMALFSFNLGVEFGQLIFIGISLIILPLLYKIFSKPLVVKICGYFIGSMGAYWMLDRTFGAYL